MYGEVLTILGVIAFSILGALFFLKIYEWRKERSSEQFELIANKYGFYIENNPGYWFHSGGVGLPQIHGTVNGKAFVLHTYSERRNNDFKLIYTEARIECCFNGYFSIELGCTTAMERLFGAEDVDIGDEIVDDLYKITIEDKTLIPQIFDEQTISLLKDARNVFKGYIRFEEDALVYNQDIELANDYERIEFEKMITVLFTLNEKLTK